MEKKDSPLAVCILGAGSHSRTFHGPALRALCAESPGRYALSGVCDLDAARAEDYAREFGFARAYADLEAMLAKERPAAVIAVTPMERTLEIGSRLLRAKMPVLIEKPPGIDTAQAHELLAVARATGTPHMVSFNRRFSPAVAKAREWVASRGASRPPLFLSARMLRHKRREANFVAHTGIHLVDTVLSLMGRPAGVRGSRVAATDPASHLYEARVAFAGGAAADLLFASAVGRLEETYDLFGEDWHVRIECQSGTVEAFEAGKPALQWRPAPADSHVYLNGTLDETRAFLDCLETGRPMQPDLAEALESFQLAETVQAATYGRV